MGGIFARVDRFVEFFLKSFELGDLVDLEPLKLDQPGETIGMGLMVSPRGWIDFKFIILYFIKFSNAGLGFV